MSAESETGPLRSRPGVSSGILKRLGTVAVAFLFMAAILFLAAGRLDWTWAWAYLGINLADILIVGPIMIRTHPETVAERGELKLAENWDKVVGVSYFLAMYIAVPLVAGLELRFGWARDLRVAWHVAGAVVFVAGLVLTTWSMMTNAYFSTAVRVQSDRGQTVCSSGPYRFVRHPGYVGYILQPIGVPILLGSLWALIPGITAAVCMVIGTSLEDRLLQAELPGYSDYVQRVRYRLVPGFW